MNEEAVLQFFASWIEKECGIVYEVHNFYQLKDRIERLTKEINVNTGIELMSKINQGLSADLKQRLIDVATNNETSFFRDAKFFSCLEKNILPEIAKLKKSMAELKIWSVASSTGQEPYSTSILLSELSEQLRQEPPIILATDICSHVLDKAKKAKYTDLEVSRGLTEPLKKKYFRPDPQGGWTLNENIKKHVQFRSLNLLDSFLFSEKFDLVLCRNVLIYQRIESKKLIVKKIYEQLAPGGILLLGAGESLMGLSSEFDQSLVDGVSVYKKKSLQKSVA